MREFLFHGKRKDNGEWVEGYLFTANWYLNDEKFTAIMRTDTTAYPHCEVSGWEEVDPETVGQYTWLTDKNGKKIFEGDIVKVTAITFFCEIIEYTEIVYLTCHQLMYDLETSNEIEVIGNIYDNPELLQMKE